MDEKKKSVSEETKEKKSADEEVIGLVGFDKIKNTLDKIDTKNTVIESEKKDQNAEEKAKDETSEKEIDSKTEDAISDKKIDSTEKVPSEEKKVLKNEEAAEEKKETNKEESIEAKKDTKKEESTETKKDIKKEESIEAKKGTKKEESTETKKDIKKEESAETKKNTSEDNKDLNKNESFQGAKKSKKRIAIIFGLLVALLAIVYIAGFVYFSNYFYPSVAINGINVSNMDKTTAKTTIDEFNKNYNLTLETIDSKKVIIYGAEIEMDIQLHDDEVDDCIKAQKAYLWFVNLMKHHDFTIEANATWNEEKLNGLYKNMQILDKKLMLEPKDAHIGIKDGKFAIVKEVLGTTINTDQFKATVNDSLAKVVANVKLQDAGCYNLPKVYSTDEALNADFATKSEFIDGVITLQLDDLTLEPGIELYDAVLEKTGNTYTISKTQVQNYVKELAAQYDTIGTERTFTSTYGGNKKVKIGGTAFGYEMDQEATANALYTALQAKKTTTVEAIFKSKGYTLQGENDIGDTYIECNLSEQKVVAYKDGKKVAEGDCVSGCEANGNGTCLGLYAIQDKLSPTVLRGEKKEVTKTVTKKNKKGKKVKVKETTMEYEYESPVTFWMQFNGGFGLHDAAGWRSVYGGSIYYYNGSHGCVNLPYDLAETLYKNFDIGDPVVVYFYDNENRK